MVNWAILNRIGARRDFFHGDSTTSEISHTSTGEQISVSFVLVEPPGTSLLTLDWPQGPDPMESTLSLPSLLGSDRDAVLFNITSRAKRLSPIVDYFVYRASSDPSKPSSLTRLPLLYSKKGNDSPRQHILSRKSTGLLSSTCTNDFIVVLLEKRPDLPSSVNMYLWEGSDEWSFLERLPVQCSDGGRNLCWWSTDAVIPYCHQSLIWVDYYRGMMFGDMGIVHKPDLRYVPLPVPPVLTNPFDADYGRGCPEASRGLCVIGNVIMFIDVIQHDSSFSIILWSLSDLSSSWFKEATLDASQLWALDTENRLPRVLPEFPVLKNASTICFLLSETRHTANPDGITCMIEVDMKKTLLRAVNSYSNKEPNQNYYIARSMSEGQSFISSEMPSYLSKMP